jgi:2-dehydropantoate 2-reductase
VLCGNEPARDEEAVAVTNAKGIKLPYADPVAHVRKVAFDTGANRASMLQDVLRGSLTEVDVINGAIVREAARVGLTAPVNATLTALVKAVETTKADRIA